MSRIVVLNKVPQPHSILPPPTHTHTHTHTHTNLFHSKGGYFVMAISINMNVGAF